MEKEEEMKLSEDLAFNQVPVDRLLEDEHLLEDDYPIYGLYAYIGEAQDGSLHMFTSNLHGITVNDAKRHGCKNIYRCNIVKRDPRNKK